MSDGDGGVSAGGFLAFCLFCYFASFLGIPVGLALMGDVLLWGWYVFLAIFGLIATGAAFGFVAKEAMKRKDRWLLFDLVVAPLATIWPAILWREPVRDFFVSAFHNQGAAVLIAAFLFFFLLLGLPAGIAGMVFSPTGPAGTVARLFISYLPLFLFYVTWAAIILNSVSPKK